MAISRRTLTRSAAWAVPSVVVASNAPAFAAVSSNANRGQECENVETFSTWGYSISSDEYLCRGFDASGNQFTDDIDKTDTMFVPFTIRVKDSGPIPEGTRFLFTADFNSEAFSGQKDNVKGVSISANSAYTVVGDNGFGDGFKTTIAIDLARDLQPGEELVVWIRVLSENKINERGESLEISGQLEDPAEKFWESSDGNGCRILSEAAFDGDRDSASQTFSNESDNDSESNRTCEGFDNKTWVTTTTVVAQS